MPSAMAGPKDGLLAQPGDAVPMALVWVVSPSVLLWARRGVSCGHGPISPSANTVGVGVLRKRDRLQRSTPQHAVANGPVELESDLRQLSTIAEIRRSKTDTADNTTTRPPTSSISGSGQRAIEELAGQTAALLNGKPIKTEAYPKQIAFNALPQIDVFLENGYTKEEMKMVWETRKIFGDESIQVNPTAVRIPVFYGHSEAVHIETRDKLSAEKATALLNEAAGVKVLDQREPGGYPTAVTEGANQDWVYVGRIREDISHPRGLNLWVVADNVRKGAATNSVQIAEAMIGNYL